MLQRKQRLAGQTSEADHEPKAAPSKSALTSMDNKENISPRKTPIQHSRLDKSRQSLRSHKPTPSPPQCHKYHKYLQARGHSAQEGSSSPKRPIKRTFTANSPLSPSRAPPLPQKLYAQPHPPMALLPEKQPSVAGHQRTNSKPPFTVPNPNHS